MLPADRTGSEVAVLHTISGGARSIVRLPSGGLYKYQWTVERGPTAVLVG